jgi:drug/metabolite transporter (DMT)-like permease
MFNDKMNSRATLLLSLTMLCYASNHVIGRAVHTDLPPMGLSFWRWVCGALILLPLVAPRLPVLIPLYREHWRVLALLGLLIVGSTTLVLLGLNFTTATNTSLINATQPTITALLCWLFLGDRLRPLQWLGIVVAFAGISLMLLQGDWRVLVELSFNPGDLVVLLAMFGFAAYGINIRRIPAEFHVRESLFAIILLGLVPLLPLYLAESFVYRPVPASIDTVLVVVVLALLVSVVGMLMWTRGNQLIGPNRAAIYVNLLPLFGALLAVLLLGESIRPYHVAGGLLIGSGMWLALRSPAVVGRE